MKKILALALAACPASLAAQQAVNVSLDNALNNSSLAAMDTNLSSARGAAALAFSGNLPVPPVHGGQPYHQGPQNPGNHGQPQHPSYPVPPQPVHPTHPSHPLPPPPPVHPVHPVPPPYNPGHPVPPPYHPGHPVPPPYNPGWNDHHPYNPPHHHDSVVVSGPMTKGALIATIAITALVLLLVLL